MIEKTSGSEKIGVSFIYIFLFFVLILCLYPLWHVLCGSISDPLQLMLHQGLLFFPLGFSLEGYRVVFENPNILIGYGNTLFYTILGTMISLLLTSFGAYALSRSKYMFKSFFTFFIIFTMYFSGGIIPNFLLIQGLQMYNTRWAILLPTAITTWNLIVMRTAFASIPESLEESAKLDGASDFTILFKIFIPISKPTIAVMTLFYAVGQWNSWFNASIYIRDRTLMPLQIFMREILIASAANASSSADTEVFFMEQLLKYATIIVSILPILFAYPFAQKYFMSGLMLGSVKE